MTTYSFETITPDQALSLQAGDQVVETSATANSATVIYASADQIDVTLAGHTVVFSGEIAAISQAGGFNFADKSILYIGDDQANTRDFGINSALGGGFFGGGGADVIQTGSGNSLLQGNAGADRFTVGAFGNNTIYGGQGDDSVSIGVAAGPLGHNFVQGNLGNDSIYGGNGVATLLGGQGDDLIGENGPDGYVDGNLGDDNLVGAGQLFGEDGADTISSSTTYSSSLFGGEGDDHLYGSAMPSPTGYEGAQNTISGGAGNDFVSSASPQDDRLQGDEGNDYLSDTSGGSDTLDGGAGDDVIALGSGPDMVYGGSGSDLVFISEAPPSVSDASKMMDWAHEDRIHVNDQPRGSADPAVTYAERTAPDFAGALTQFHSVAGANTIVAVQVGADVVVFAHAGAVGQDDLQSLILVGRTLADIDASNFI